MAKKIDINHDEQMAADMRKIKEGFDILAEAVTSLNQQGLKVNLSDEQLRNISEAASAGVKHGASSVILQAPDITSQTSVIADAVYKRVSDRIISDFGNSLEKTIEDKKATIKLEHYHTSMYGRYASSEKNRKMMIWLTLINVIQAFIIGYGIYAYFDSSYYWGKRWYSVCSDSRQVHKELIDSRDKAYDIVISGFNKGEKDEIKRIIKKYESELRKLPKR